MDLSHVFEKKGIVLLAQADHVSGEILGSAIEELYEAGAYNVQVISTVTKKNRPGHLFVVDCGEKECESVEAVLLMELGVTGWHRIITGHRHVGTRIDVHAISFETPSGVVELPARVKQARRYPLCPRPEHSSCVEIREALRKQNVFLSLERIRTEIIQQIEHQTSKEDKTNG